MERQIDGYKWIDRQIDRYLIGIWIDRQMDIDGQIDTWRDGWINRQIDIA